LLFDGLNDTRPLYVCDTRPVKLHL